MSKKRIIACIPLTWPYIPTPFFESILNMIAYSSGRYNFGTIIRQHCYLHLLREQLVEEALKHSPDYLLWLDADQTYPADTPERLARHEKLIVGGLTPGKDDGTSLVFEFTGKDGTTENGGLICQNTEPNYGVKRVHLTPNNGLQKVEIMGFGGILTDVKLFAVLKPPYFLPIWKEVPSKAGEDIVFYKNCQTAGVDVFCDTDVLFEHIVQERMRVKS